MAKKILYTAFVALGIAAIGMLLWWLFLRPSTNSGGTTNLGSGTLGTSGNTSGQTNIGSPVVQSSADTNPEQAASATKNVSLGTTGIDSQYSAGYQTSSNGLGSYQPNSILYAGTNLATYSSTTNGSLATPGVSWLSGSSGDTRNTSGTVFNPTGVNQLVTPDSLGDTGIIPDFGSAGSGQQSGGLGIVGAALGAGVAGAISCGAAELFSKLGEALGLSKGVGEATALSAPVLAAQSVIGVQVADGGAAAATVGNAGATGGAGGAAQATDSTVNTFMACIARTIAKVAIQQITNSVVNWINSGFNGSPSFVQNPTQFFTNVADQAAGDFIKGSSLSFLCSPFQLKIKIAIANSYARRGAQSCTLTGVIKNINNFMSGDFNSGGWPGMLSFTTTPTNNPYGGLLYAQVGITYAEQTAVGTQQRQLALGKGFLDFKKIDPSSCTIMTSNPGETPDRSVTPGARGYEVCKKVTTTPGTVIEDSLHDTLGKSIDGLNLAKSFDEIISALITQLMSRALQGLSGLSGQNGYASNFQTPDQQQAIGQAQTLLSEMQADAGYAQQYGGIMQSSISDIQSSQQQLNTLYNCWNSVATGSTTDQRKQTATTNALAASSTLQSLQPAIDTLNGKITTANNAIVVLQTLESQALSALSTSDIDAVTSSYRAALTNGQIYTQTDVTSATQDRTTLQSQLSALDQQTSAGLTQCNAF